jgi:hypothetical protein
MLVHPRHVLTPGLDPGIRRATAQRRRRRDIRECLLLAAFAALCQLLSMAVALYVSGHLDL